MFFLSLWKMSNCLNKLIKDPFPNGLVMEALYAIVGYSFERCWTHFFKAQTGMRSALLIKNIMCLWGQFFFKCSSKAADLVPWGSLASKTWTTTSLQSITLWSSYQILLLCPADILLSLFSASSSSSSSIFKLKSLVWSYSVFSIPYTNSYIDAKPTFAFFLLLWGPKVYW